MNRQVKVGLFVAMGLLVGAVLVFLIGEERHLFERQFTVWTSFRDVAGLRVGSPVRMGGVDVGQVEVIEFSDDPANPQIRVRATLIASLARRVRRDSVARVVSKGLLGDKALEISMGTVARPPVPAGGTIPGEASDDLGAAIQSAGTALERANEVLNNVVIATRPLANDRLGNDLLAITRDVRTITHGIAEGPGTFHQLLADPTTAQRLENTLGATQTAANRIAASAADVQAIAREARAGRGLVHALVYDPAGGTMVRSLARAADELGAITRDVRTGDGGLHRLIYGQDAAEMVANLNATSADVRAIVRDVRAGRGTVGALLVDPSLYEDLKGLVGNLQRNEILRALVRYSIHQDQTPPAAPTARSGAAVPSAEATPTVRQARPQE